MNPGKGMPRHTAKVVHHCHTRLHINAGMEFPSCYANTPLLDTGKGSLPTTSEWSDVTCKRCIAIGSIKAGGK